MWRLPSDDALGFERTAEPRPPSTMVRAPESLKFLSRAVEEMEAALQQDTGDDETGPLADGESRSLADDEKPTLGGGGGVQGGDARLDQTSAGEFGRTLAHDSHLVFPGTLASSSELSRNIRHHTATPKRPRNMHARARTRTHSPTHAHAQTAAGSIWTQGHRGTR